MDHSTDDARRTHDPDNPLGPDGLPLGMMPGLNTHPTALVQDPPQRKAETNPVRTVLYGTVPALGVAGVVWYLLAH